MVRAAFRMLVFGAILLAALAFAVLHPRTFEAILPDTAITFLEGLTGPGADGAPRNAGQSPADYLEDGAEGLLAQGPIAAGPGNSPVFIRDAVTGYSVRLATGVPAEITTIRPILGCRLTPPQSGSIVGHVVAGSSGVATALATYNDTHLAAEVQVFVDHYRRTGMADPAQTPAPAYEAYDVAVTETLAPVYLVLESGTGNRLWNIHLAEGARIERVVLLGADQAGVANLDPVVPVEVLLNGGLRACDIEPAYVLNPGHRLYQDLASGSSTAAEADQRIAAQLDAARRYDTWFHDSFGVKAGESRIGYAAGTISIIGPVPGAGEPKAVSAPILGAKVRMTRDTYLEIAGQVPEGEDFASRVRAIATAFAFGDLTNLRQGARF